MMRFKEELDISDLNNSLMTSYEKYMRNTLRNDSNTVRTTIKRIHTVLNYFVKNNIIEENPIKGFMVKGEPSRRVYLTPEELASFERLRISDSLHNEERRNVYRYFLFACYTSLRYSDVKDLMYKDISFSSEKFFLNLVTQKTKEQIMVPLIKKAIDIIGSIKKGDEKVFTVYSTQKTNSILRELISEARIDKYISFHCSRHTFATTALNNGIAMATIQKLLGHENIKTTQIYSKLRDETLFKEMEKME
jgi:site-specific recombinase XerD